MENEKIIYPVSIFGEYVFNDSVMKSRLPKATYKTLKKTIDQGLPIDPSIADVVANTMKDWAIEKGATHFTHWFQPMTGITAEKHDAFISPTSDGKVVMEFSGKELIKGEPDASSFPSGGLRATFEARGYTAWDCTSPAFVKDGTLYIPTVFISYTGEALDKKAPLIRSTEALSKSAMRILKLFGNTDSTLVTTTVGPEQEYFLVDRALYNKRLDLMLAGRTLFGAKPPKGQELDDQYFARLRMRVSEFMHDLDNELWKLGITAKTKHNEVAPAQHELALIFDSANVATDHNQTVMLTMRKIAKKHGLACLLHEKPFDGVNGSGKHVNWSMSTDDGQNLLEPGKTPRDNAQFLLFLSSVIKAVDDYADLLRLTVASAGNDHRLGANEAPPAVISMFVGEELSAVLESIETGKPYAGVERSTIDIGATSLPNLPKDTTDRNRTSPFAFTGNKFEFRMAGSSQSVASPCYVLNAAVADILAQFADRLGKADDFMAEVKAIVKETIKDHKRVIFNGNGYTDEWIEEAAKRGLPNFANTVDAIEVLKDQKNIDMLKRTGIMTEVEIESRYEIHLENYSKIINIEALTMLEMANRQLIPATLSYLNQLATLNVNLKAAGAASKAASDMLAKVAGLADSFEARTAALKAAVDAASEIECPKGNAKAYRDSVLTAMADVRAVADELETIISADVWPIPTYADLLFRV
ncbi:MAG TPA: glutamine synthetase III [Ruminiclostridium sp.]|nr:glutamine synthetase III [Ruminiclostridium sp.]